MEEYALTVIGPQLISAKSYPLPRLFIISLSQQVCCNALALRPTAELRALFVAWRLPCATCSSWIGAMALRRGVGDASTGSPTRCSARINPRPPFRPPTAGVGKAGVESWAGEAPEPKPDHRSSGHSFIVAPLLSAIQRNSALLIPSG